mgnify:CR=1 FL=1
MRYRTLGDTDLVVSVIGFGGWAIGGDWGEVDDTRSDEALRTAVDLGITFFDTADVYGFGHSERLCGRVLSSVRDRVVIATKGGLRWNESGRVWRDCSPKYITGAVEASLRRLQTDVIDLYQIHAPDPKIPQAETMECLSNLVDEGKIRYVGVSNYSVPQMRDAAGKRRVDTLQTSYHLLYREAECELLPYCRSQNIGVISYGALAHGLLTGLIDSQRVFPKSDWRASSKEFVSEGLKRNVSVAQSVGKLAHELGKSTSELAIAWTIANPDVNTVIVGARNSAQVKMNAGADFLVPEEYMAILNSLVSDKQWADVPFPRPT